MPNLTLRSTKGAPLTHTELDGNFEYFTGSIDAINAITSSFISNADTGSFLTSADTGSFLTSADTASFVTTSQTASLNISNALYTVNSALSASTTSSATTSVCSYGVNMFEYVTATDFATKLPQPTTGKSVRVINNSTSLLYVYPSNVGGNINNLPIDTPAILPPDGKPYEFICIKNPLPGAWTFLSPATGQYDSGEIEISITAQTIPSTFGPFNTAVIAYDAPRVSLLESFFGTNYWAFNGKHKSDILDYISSGKRYIAFRPSSAWKGIAKIKVYTNLISEYAESSQVRLYATGESDYYSLNDDSFLSNGPSPGGVVLFDFNLNKHIAGTATTGSTAYNSANIGDPGTVWGEKVAFMDSDSNVNIGTEQGTLIGGKDLGNAPYPYDYFNIPGNPTPDGSGNDIYKGDPVNKFYSSYISFQMIPMGSVFDYGTISDFKFRFIIEYYQ